jgi:hypothetical protein
VDTVVVFVVRYGTRHTSLSRTRLYDERRLRMDKLTIIGNLGQDPEMRYTPNGKAVTNFSVASNHKWTGADGEKHEQTV